MKVSEIGVDDDQAWLQDACLDLAKARETDIRKTEEIGQMPDNNKCIVHGCSNHADQGRFVGEMCSPCHIMITTGKMMPTDSFLNQITSLEAENEKLKNILRKAFPEKSGHFFICGESGEKDSMGLPDRLFVCPAYGLDEFAVYKKDRDNYAPEIRES
jgi:hypothetical protein